MADYNPFKIAQNYYNTMSGMLGGISGPGGIGKTGAGGAIIGLGVGIASQETEDGGLNEGGAAQAIADMETAEKIPGKTSADFAEVDSGFIDVSVGGQRTTIPEVAYNPLDDIIEVPEAYDTYTPEPAEAIEYLTPVKNELLINRGINILRTEILMLFDFIPVVDNLESSEVNSSLFLDLDQTKINVTQMLRLIELHRSVNQATKNIASLIINQTFFELNFQLGETLMSDPVIESTKKYMELFYPEKEVIEISYNPEKFLDINDFLFFLDKSLRDFATNFRIYHEMRNGIASVEQFLESVINNAIRIFQEFNINNLDQSSNQFVKENLIVLLLRNNEFLLNSFQFKSLVEISIIKDLLRKFSSFVNGAFDLQNKYRKAIDFSIMSNEYGPQSSLANDDGAMISQVIQNLGNISNHSNGIVDFTIQQLAPGFDAASLSDPANLLIETVENHQAAMMSIISED